MDDLDLQPFKNSSLGWWPVGSRETCDPAPTGTDIDFLVQVKRLTDASRALSDIGFVSGTGSEYKGMAQSNFASWRRREINLIVSPDVEFIQAFLAATSVAKRFNLLKKDDRIALFRAVLYRLPCDAA